MDLVHLSSVDFVLDGRLVNSAIITDTVETKPSKGCLLKINKITVLVFDSCFKVLLSIQSIFGIE